MKENATGSAIGPALGNGLAYFAMLWIGVKYEYTFDDPELAVAMGGAVVATLLLEIKKIGRGIMAGVRYFIPKKKTEE